MRSGTISSDASGGTPTESEPTSAKLMEASRETNTMKASLFLVVAARLRNPTSFRGEEVASVKDRLASANAG
jgi:hypothetical protein